MGILSGAFGQILCSCEKGFRVNKMCEEKGGGGQLQLQSGGLSEFLTEYDDGIGSELKVDPLGMLVIWSAFGQQIFRSRVSSISNDVRNYTLNLFNHWLVRELIEDERVVLGTALAKRYAGKQDLNFKYACLLYLENLFVYSMLHAEAQQRPVETVGVLGISNAGRKWHESGSNPTLLFSHESQAQVLVRQLLLGVSGRYKTPLVELGFFDRSYQYDLPMAKSLWAQATSLVDSTPALKKLAIQMKAHLRELLADSRSELRRQFFEVPNTLKQALAEAFSSPVAVGCYARHFWLSVTELDQGASGALYRALLPMSGEQGLNAANTADLFAQALLQPLLAEERIKLEHIRRLEPLLAELDLLFTLMLSEPEQSLDGVKLRWQAMGRDAQTLARQAQPLVEDAPIFAVLSAAGRSRLSRFLALAQHADVPQQVRALLAYHESLMEERGQSSWLKLNDRGQLKLHVATRRSPTNEDRPLGSWINPYYIPQFRSLLRGLLGGAA